MMLIDLPVGYSFKAPLPRPGARLGHLSEKERQLVHFIDRVHPEYHDKVEHWDFLKATYEGGRDWFDKHIFKYQKEGQEEFNDRVQRAYRFNHTREVVDLVCKYLFKQPISRATEAPKSVQKFWKRSTLNGLSIREFSRQIAKKSAIMGRVAVVIDNNAGEFQVTSRKDEQNAPYRIYGYTVGPDQLEDYAYDGEGKVEWAKVREVFREDGSPFESTGELYQRYRLWTKEGWQLFSVKEDNKHREITVEDMGTYKIKQVPVIIADHIISDEVYTSPALIEEIAYLDRAVANYLSNLDAIIQDQTFSQLVIPAQGLQALEEDDAHALLLKMGTKRIFTYDAEAGGAPSYISPDPKQAGMIMEVIQKIINEIYHTVGLAGERTKQDNAVGTDNSSGVAKAFDFEKVNALLASKADSIEHVENRMVEIVAAWAGEKMEDDHETVKYPDDFDSRGIVDEFDIAAKLQLLQAPDVVRQEQMFILVEKIFPHFKEKLLAALESQIKAWPVDPVEQAADMAGATAKATAPYQAKPAAGKPNPKSSRQGEVTKSTS